MNKTAFQSQADHPHLVLHANFRSRDKWRSHHSICHIQKLHATRKIHGPMFYRSGVIADGSFTLQEYRFLTKDIPIRVTCLRKDKM